MKKISRNGKDVYYYDYKAKGESEAVVFLVHGMVEYAMRYEKVCKKLSENGITVYAMDNRAHGKTDEENLGYSQGDIANETLLDMLSMIKKIKAENSDKKIFLLGHSYGSFLSQRFIELYPDEIDGLILSGSCKNKAGAIKFGKSVAKMAIAFGKEKKPAKFIKKCTFDIYNKKFKNKCFLSSNEESNEEYRRNKFSSFICSYAFYYYFFKMLDSLYSKNVKINENLPILLLSGKDDPVGDYGKGVIRLKEYYEKKGFKNIGCKIYEEKRHELLNEKDWEKYYKEIENFIKV